MLMLQEGGLEAERKERERLVMEEQRKMTESILKVISIWSTSMTMIKEILQKNDNHDKIKPIDNDSWRKTEMPSWLLAGFSLMNRFFSNISHTLLKRIIRLKILPLF